MMRFKNGLFLVMSLLCAASFFAKPIAKPTVRSVANWKALCEKYVPPMLLSGAVGAGTGYLVRYIEKELGIGQPSEDIIWLAALWFGEYTLRNSIIASIQKDFDDCNIAYRKNMMYFTAWITSWLSYVNAK